VDTLISTFLQEMTVRAHSEVRSNHPSSGPIIETVDALSVVIRYSKRYAFTSQTYRHAYKGLSAG